MKKKVLYGAALALFASVSMGTLQSCKDDLSDLRHENAYEHQALEDQLKQLREDVFGVNGESGVVSELKSELKGDIEDLKGDIATNQAELTTLINNSTAENQTKINNLRTELEGQLQELEEKMEALSNAEKVQEKLNALEALLKAYTDSKLTEGKDYTDQQVAAMKTVLESKIADEVMALNATISSLTTKVNNLEAKFGEYVTTNTFNTTITQLTTRLTAIEENYDKLVVRVTKLEADYETQLKALNDAKQEIEELWKDSDTQRELISEVYQALTDEINERGLEYTQLSNEIDLLNEAVFGEYGLQAQISQTANALREEFQTADEELWNAILERDIINTQAMNTIRAEFAEADEELWAAIRENQEHMTQYYNALRQEFTEADEEIYLQVEAVREEMTMFMNASNAAIEALQNEDEQIWLAINGHGGLQEQITSLLNLHQADIEAIEKKIDDLKKELTDRIDALVTGILIQGTDNPVFGNFSLPIGVKSNMLFNWYGFNSSAIENFPSDKKAFAYDKETPGINFTGIASEPVVDGFLGDVNLGRVYLTVNPIGHNFANTEFTLETSAGKPLPFKLKISESDDELSFGYTRGAKNGFYAADVVIEGDQNSLNKGINATKIVIDDNLKTAVKNVLNDKSKHNALELLKAVYGQLSGMLPAYAVRYDWNVNGEDYAVLSNYDLAVASAKPLSYQFFYDQSFSKRIPTYGHISAAIERMKEEFKGKLQIKFTPINFGDLTIQLPDIDLSDIHVKSPGINITVEVDPIEVWETLPDGSKRLVDTVTPVIKLDGLKDIDKQITSSMEEAITEIGTRISNWTGTANEKVSAQLQDKLKPIAQNINDMVESLQGQLDSAIDDIFNKAESFAKRLDRLVDLYNKVAGKVNNVLEDPNHYLQVAMFYQGGKYGMNVLSNDKNDPTIFNSGKGYVGLYASSYSAELVAPAFKKFVAVSNVYKKDGKNIVVADNAADEMAKINGSNHFNEVMSGNTIRYSIPAEKLTKGLIYEIVYQGLDYHGVTSTQKFYITVK